ncbi:MAG: DUF3048 domain-containing protein [Oscillospiraceae bacterium]|jgi:hypothetical protein|nr:DUF3048 domain-containing protein [Oscillospiraceae bacterium]
MQKKHANKLSAAALVLLLLLSISTCSLALLISPRAGGGSVSSPTTAVRAFSDNPVPFGKSPTTGLDFTGEYKPVMVQISNGYEGDRPQWNLSEADIVYESIYWGPGHTRYSAIFSDNHPSFVGPVRSARIQHVMLREEWDAPFVFWGGQKDAGTNIYDLMDSYKLKRAFRWDGTSNDTVKYMGRSSGQYARPNPHDAIADIAALVANMWPVDHIPKSHAFKFSDETPKGNDTAVEIEINYWPGKEWYHPSFKYNAATGVYDRYYNGELSIDGYSGEQMVAANVIVQRQKLTYYNGTSSRPIYEVVGEGEADIFIDGQFIRGKWIRSSINDRTVFTTSLGVEVALKPGKTFIQIIPNTLDYTYTNADGVRKTMSLDDSKISWDETQEIILDDAELNKTE